MAARDDSVIRGSLIASLIFLVLSLALNFFFWRWGDTQAKENEASLARLKSTQDDVRAKESQLLTLKFMLGSGTLSDGEIDQLSQSSSGDAEMDAIAAQFVRDMAYFDQDTAKGMRTYPALPAFFINHIRNRNEVLVSAMSDVEAQKRDKEQKVMIAQAAQAQAKQDQAKAESTLEQETTQFTKDREAMKVTTEEIRDSLNKTVQDFGTFRRQKIDEISKVTKRSDQLLGTVETQRQELNRLRSDKFESTQGEITYVLRDGNVVMINLGSADMLRPGVTFGVIDADETRLEDAKVKASIQVTKIRGDHLAEARVVARPEIKYPIIPNDKIYSPFWSPGRTVRIAIAGDIDLDGDQRPDTEAITGMIKAAGAEVAAVLTSTDELEKQLDSSIRFLVVGESPTVSDSTVSGVDDANAALVATIGSFKQVATELGITIIPAWKLQAYLKTIDDSLTTPLGSAVRGDDFEPERIPGSTKRRPTDLPEMYKHDDEKVQKGNEIKRP